MASADALRATTAKDFDDVADEIDKLVLAPSSGGSTSVTSAFSSSSYTAIGSMSETVTVGANDDLLILWTVSFSFSKQDSVWAFAPHEDGTLITSSAYVLTDARFTTESHGYSGFATGHMHYTPASPGSLTIDLRWKRDTGTGAAYSKNRYLTVIVLPQVNA